MLTGGGESKKRENRLRESYEKENSIKYDYILYTRMDILFASPLNIQRYIDLYTKGNMKNFPLPQKHCFAAFNPFVRMPVIDIRHINEGDIVYFTNYPHDEFKPEKCLELFIIMIDYKLYRNFFLQRRDFITTFNFDLKEYVQLESYPDYKEALKEKECLTYKLGEAMIEADKSPLKLGYITLWFKCKKIQRECRKDK